MKHLNKMIAATALSFPFMAQAAMGDYTVVPAPGVVEELTQFQINFDETGLDEVELDTYSIEVRKDGAFFSDVKKKGYGFSYTCTLNTPATEAGEYEVVIAAGGITYWSDDYATDVTSTEPVTFSYTIEGGAATQGGYTVDPEPGVVDELTKFSISFNREGYESIELESSSVSVMKDGAFFSDIKKSGYDFDFTCTLNTPATEPGEYEVVIEPGGVTYYDAEYNDSYNTEAIKLAYTIKAPLTGEVIYDIEFTKFNPAEGEVDLDMFQFDNFKMWTSGDGLKLNNGASVTITADNGYASTGTFRMPYANYYYAPIDAVTKDGTYTVVIPAATIVDAEYIETEGKSGHANAEPTLVYTCVNGLPAGTPVVYDLNVATVTPAAGTLDLGSKAFDSVTIKLEDGCAFAEDKFTLTMTAPQEQGDIELNFTSSYTGYLAFFNEPTYDGDYILVIPEGSFGDASWIANHAYGHANAEVVLKWTLSGGVPTSIEVVNAETLEAPVYDLNGVRVANSLREAGAGIFVVNGQKVIVKK